MAKVKRTMALGVMLLLLVAVATIQLLRNKKASDEVPPTGLATFSATEIFRRVSPSVFVVEIIDSQYRIIATGSGVAVGEGQVITNKHVLSGGRPRLRHGDRVWNPHRVLNHPRWDLALLMVDDLNVPIARIETRVSVGDRVYAIGAPKGLELTFSEGLISSIRERVDGRIIQTSAAISPGSSGGGLFNEHGNLVGITVGGYQDGQNLNFAIPGEAVTDLVTARLPPRSLLNGTEVVEPVGGKGRGKLTIDNGTNYDATVKLVDGYQVRRWTYVKAKSTVTLTGITPCFCRVLFASGLDWDSVRLTFTRDRSFTGFDEPFEFSERSVGNKIRFDTVRITLHPVPLGQAKTRKISEKEFEAATIH